MEKPLVLKKNDIITVIFSDTWKNSSIDDFTDLPEPIRYGQPSKGGGKKNLTALHLFNVHKVAPPTQNTPPQHTKAPLLANTERTYRAFYTQNHKFHPSLPALWIEGYQQALQAPLTAFFLHLASERSSKDWLCVFAEAGGLSSKPIWAFLIFSLKLYSGTGGLALTFH